MNVIRYSQAFKLKVVREIEVEGAIPFRVARKYGIRSPTTVMIWLRRYGLGKHGKIVRIQDVKETDEIKRLRDELRRVKDAYADSQMDLALERAYLEILAEQAGITDLEYFRKKHSGRQRTGR